MNAKKIIDRRLHRLGTALLLGVLLGAAACDDDSHAPDPPAPNPLAEACIPYSYYEDGSVPVDPLIHWPVGARDIAIAGDYLLMACGYSGIQIADLAGGGEGHIIASVPTGDATRLCVQDNLLAVADNGYGVALIDISDPSAPVRRLQRDIVGTGTYGGSAGQSFYVALHGDDLFVSGNYHQIFRFDISDPSRPVLLERYERGKDGTAMIAADGLLYVGLDLILDITRTPLRVVAEIGEGGANDLILRGSALHAASGGDLVTVDVSDPYNPRVVDRRDLHDVRCVAASGDRVFVAGPVMGLAVFDFFVSGTPVLAAETDPNLNFGGLALREGLLYFSGYYNYGRIDVSDPSHPAEPVVVENVRNARTMAVTDEALVLSANESFLVYDLAADPLDGPSAILTDDNQFDSDHLAGDGSLVYFTRRNEGWQILDLSTPSSPVLSPIYAGEQGFSNLSLSTSKIAVRRGRTIDLYDRPGGLEGATLLGSWSSAEDIHAMHLAGDRLLVSLDRAQLVLLDCTDPTAIDTLARDPDNPFFCDSRAVRWLGDRAIDFHGAGCCGLRLAVPDEDGIFQQASFVDTGDYAGDLQIFGNAAYTLASRYFENPHRRQSVLVVTALDDPNALHRLGSGTVKMQTYSKIAVAGNHVYGLREAGIDRFWIDCRSLD